MPTNDMLFGEEEKISLTRSSKTTLQEQIAKIMKRKIKSGEYFPGDKLPSVRELAEIFNVSRETAKLSFGALKEEGFIEILPSRGAYVRKLIEPVSPDAKTGNIGFIIDLGDGPQPPIAIETIFENLLQFVESQIENWGNHLLTSHIIYGDEAGRERFAGIVEKVDGLFVTGLINPELLQELQTLPVPVVSILSNLDVDQIDEVGINSWKTYYKIVHYLIQAGHKKIAYLDGPKEYFQELQRIAGCTTAVGENTSGEISFYEYHAAGWSPETGYEAAKKLLRSEPDTDAILAVNDVLGIGVLRACFENGYRIPEDISIIGAKNTILSKNSNPVLSSVNYHFDEIARVAAARMKDLIRSPDRIPVKTQIIGDLVNRQSTRRSAAA